MNAAQFASSRAGEAVSPGLTCNYPRRTCQTRTLKAPITSAKTKHSCRRCGPEGRGTHKPNMPVLRQHSWLRPWTDSTTKTVVGRSLASPWRSCVRSLLHPLQFSWKWYDPEDEFDSVAVSSLRTAWMLRRPQLGTSGLRILKVRSKLSAPRRRGGHQHPLWPSRLRLLSRSPPWSIPSGSLHISAAWSGGL